MLKKGDPCYVRLPNGNIALGKYDGRHPEGKMHFVFVGNNLYLSVNKIEHKFDCRFVCMTGLNKVEENG